MLDVNDGGTVALAERPDLILQCDRHYEYDDVYGELDAGDGNRDEYRRASDDALLRLCDVSGDVVDPPDLLATGEPTPSWFGVTPERDDDEDADQEPEAADRWAVWVVDDIEPSEQLLDPAPTRARSAGAPMPAGRSSPTSGCAAANRTRLGHRRIDGDPQRPTARRLTRLDPSGHEPTCPVGSAV